MSDPVRTLTAEIVARPQGDRLHALRADPVPEASAQSPEPAATEPSQQADARPRRSWGKLAWLLGIGLPLALINLVGMPYYTASPGIRVRHPWHAMLRPSGTVGLTAGIIAVLIFVFLWLYPLRKRFRQLGFLGSLGKWMDVHVTLALALPLLLAIHSAWRADGLIGLGLLAMLIVIASGVVGRYLYVRIPRARNGAELTREEVANRRRELVGSLAITTGLSIDVVERTLEISPEPTAGQGVLVIFGRLLSDDLLRWRQRAALRRRWAAVAPAGHPLSKSAVSQAVRLASQELSLRQQVAMLHATQRVFRYWHIAHRPFAITALVAVVIHIAVVMAVGVVGF